MALFSEGETPIEDERLLRAISNASFSSSFSILYVPSGREDSFLLLLAAVSSITHKDTYLYLYPYMRCFASVEAAD